MTRFCKKPVEIDAIQWTGYNEVEVMAFIDAGDDPPAAEYHQLTADFSITTLEGVMLARVGDWLIRGIQGELYPCKPDIFEQTYEAVGV